MSESASSTSRLDLAASLPPPAPERLRWISCRALPAASASGDDAPAHPGPAPPLADLLPVLQARGLMVGGCGLEGLRLGLEAGHCLLLHPKLRLDGLGQPPDHPLGLWPCSLRGSAQPGPGPGRRTPAAADPGPRTLQAWICHPVPPQPSGRPEPTRALLLLGAGLIGLVGDCGPRLELGLAPAGLRWLDPRQLRGQLLEFLKFRVLAAQEEFFSAFHASAADRSDASRYAIAPFRAWLTPLWPDACHLPDSDLRDCLEQAHTLYVN